MLRRLLLAAVVLAAVPPFIPEALAFPYRRQVGDLVISAEQPIPDAITAVVARAERLRRASEIDGPGHGRRVFLTDGGWRWHWLAFQTLGAFGQTRPFRETMVINHSDVARDRVFNGQVVGGERSLSGVLAHEETHGLIRARYGPLADARYPAWLREGYCDVIAGEGSLSDAQAAMLEHRGEPHPALLYYHGRKRVEALLRVKDGSVDQVFASAALW